MTGALADHIVVFAGPSIPPSRRPDDPRFLWFPPAAAGDIDRLSSERPRSVVLIDGLFDATPSVRHKELLALIGRGVPLIGGASMGALRAAELHRFGMIGIGSIFEAFARGVLVGDDEVALLHAGPEWDWSPFTEPLVNIRASLCKAVRSRVIDLAVARRWRWLAARVFYQDRTWPALTAAWSGDGAIKGRSLESTLAWFAADYVDLKARDAGLCLAAALRLNQRPAQIAAPPVTVFAAALARQSRARPNASR